MGITSEKEIDKIIKQASNVAAGDFSSHEPTARGHAMLMALQIKINGELIKTTRSLAAKNEKLQKLLFVLSVVATFCAIVAVFK